ncbi:MAG: hypothetical protein ACK55V_14465 [Alphaproteobacteria bacterium]|jgi:hypothetical protein
MRHAINPAILAIALCIAPMANAGPCKSQGAPDARELTFDIRDTKVLQGLEVSFQLGLLPEDFPEKDIAEKKEPCSRGTFTLANGMSMDLRGENDESPQRWAVSSIPGTTVYVAATPRPDAALRFIESYKGEKEAEFNKKDMMYAIVLTRGDDKRRVFHFFDKIPTDDRLKELLRPITISKGREQVMFDTTQRRVFAPTR